MDIPVMQLEWSAHRPPDEQCRYDHTEAETPFGRFLITWKGWKEYSRPTIDEAPWGDIYESFSSVAEAKAAAESQFSSRVLLCLGHIAEIPGASNISCTPGASTGLKEAITHAEVMAVGDTQCAKDHGQLAIWLRERISEHAYMLLANEAKPLIEKSIIVQAELEAFRADAARWRYTRYYGIDHLQFEYGGGIRTYIGDGADSATDAALAVMNAARQ